jgi:hypothetical protein
MSHTNLTISCELKECKKQIDNPITLPCGFLICQTHVEQYKEKFKCPICDLEHVITKSGLDLNNNVIEMMNCVNLHCMNLNEHKNEDIIKFDEFEKIADDLNFI